MDIQVSSNFERLLFELLDRDGAEVARLMKRFAKSGSFDVAENVLRSALSLFSGFCLMMMEQRLKSGQLISRPEWLLTHSAVGLAGARQARALVWSARIRPPYHWLVRIQQNFQTLSSQLAAFTLSSQNNWLT